MQPQARQSRQAQAPVAKVEIDDDEEVPPAAGSWGGTAASEQPPAPLRRKRRRLAPPCSASGRPSAAKSGPFSAGGTAASGGPGLAPTGVEVATTFAVAAPQPLLTLPQQHSAHQLTPLSDGLLTDAEQRELKEAVLSQLKRTIIGQAEEAKVLAEFVSVLVEQQRSRSEMATELAVLEDQAEAFASWVEERKSSILARRSLSRFRPLLRTGLRAQLTPNQFTSLEVVVTDKLILQPSVAAANNRKLELLAEMTKQLREILGKLSDPALDDKSREKYQLVAQRIQGNMGSLAAVSRIARA